MDDLRRGAASSSPWRSCCGALPPATAARLRRPFAEAATTLRKLFGHSLCEERQSPQSRADDADEAADPEPLFNAACDVTTPWPSLPIGVHDAALLLEGSTGLR